MFIRFDPSSLKPGDWIEFLAGWDQVGRLFTRGERVDDVSRAAEYCIVRAWREDDNGFQLSRYFPPTPMHDDMSDICWTCKGPCIDPECHEDS